MTDSNKRDNKAAKGVRYGELDGTDKRKRKRKRSTPTDEVTEVTEVCVHCKYKTTDTHDCFDSIFVTKRVALGLPSNGLAV